MPLDKDTPALVGQFADQPIRLERVPEPRFRPAMSDTSPDKGRVEMLAFLVEKRKLSAGLIKAAGQIAALDGVRTALAIGMTVYG